jgi:cyclic pyranopterin phosphate synthase
MPEAGIPWKPHDAILSFEELLRICGLMAGLGLSRIRVTGGEPLVRKGTGAFIRRLKAVPGVKQVSLTTNGLLLGAHLDELAGLDSINVSLDSLDPETFRRVTRFSGPGGDAGFPAAILRTVERARSLGIPVKINCVILRHVNQQEIFRIAALAEHTVDAVRFIELMPIGGAGEQAGLPGAELRALLEQRFGRLQRVPDILGCGPAEYYSLPGFAGRIGFIDAITGGFCERCNRLRLSAEGFLKPCLSSDMGLDLRALLRSGASDAALVAAVRDLAARKPRAHSFSGLYGAGAVSHADKVMSSIGG